MDEQPKDLAGHDLSRSLLRDIFDGLGNNRPKETFCYIADDVQWTVTNEDPESKSHPIAGLYKSKQEFMAASLQRLNPALTEPLCLVMNREPYVFVNGDDDQVALVELIAKTPSGGMPVGKNGARYDQRFAWVCTWSKQRGLITNVRAYLDSAMINNLLA